MTIRNPNGSVFKPTGSLQQFDPENPEHDLFNLWDQEVIQIGGSPLYYYDLFINIQNIDQLYVEARDKLWSPCPVCIYGYYDPISSSNQLGMFGIDSPDEIMLEFNYRHVLKTLGKPPQIGTDFLSAQTRELGSDAEECRGFQTVGRVEASVDVWQIPRIVDDW